MAKLQKSNQYRFKKKEKLYFNIFFIVSVLISVFIFCINMNKINSKSNKLPIIYKNDTEETVKEKVPNVVGMEFNSYIKNPPIRFKIVKLSEEFDLNVPEGSIISQNPEPGTFAYENFTVCVNVSKGPKERILPKISGLFLSDACKLLTDLKFIPIQKKVENSDFIPGTIIGYDAFEAGQIKNYGENVVILVSY